MDTAACDMGGFLAKSKPPETIREHTDNLLELLVRFCAQYPEALSDSEKEITRYAAEYHDFGKTEYIFRRNILAACGRPFERDPVRERLYEGRKSFPHGYLSPAFLPIDSMRRELGDDGLRALVNAIYYHHTRDEEKPEFIKRVLSEDLEPELGKSYQLNSKYLMLVQTAQSSFRLKSWLLFAVVKGTLNRLDYAASGNTGDLELPRLQDGKSFADIVEAELTKRFELRPVQRYMKENRNKNLVVIASTGVGKTEAACLWAGDGKLFYTLPLKVSINAIYERLHGSGDGEYSFQSCALLHSDALSILFENEGNEDVLLKYNKTRLFSYPVTVCTVDQLFTFVYKFRGSEIIPAVLKYSRIVIDEIQAYSPDIAAKLIIGLKLIGELGGRFAVITATMPPMLEDAMKSRGIEFERPTPFFSPLMRHHLCCVRSDFNTDDIAQKGSSSKVLVICNTVRAACGVYERLSEIAEPRLLHSRFKLRDRRLLESDIMDFSRSDEAGIWVTTQIVEASLDIDFDYLYTEMCPADNLLQRLGRCYRKRDYLGEGPNVFVHETGSGVGTVYDREIYARSMELLPQYCGRVVSEEEKNEYVCAVYNTQALLNTAYYREFRKTLDNLQNLPPAYFSAKEAAEKFREIISVSVIDDEDYYAMRSSGELEELGRRMESGDAKERALAKRQLLDHTISINPMREKVKPDMSSPILRGRKPGACPPIYRIQTDYDFDPYTHRGLGLGRELREGSNFI